MCFSPLEFYYVQSEKSTLNIQFHVSQVKPSTQPWRKNRVKLYHFFLKISVFQLPICSALQSGILPILCQYSFSKHPLSDYRHIFYEDHIFFHFSCSIQIHHQKSCLFFSQQTPQNSSRLFPLLSPITTIRFLDHCYSVTSLVSVFGTNLCLFTFVFMSEYHRPDDFSNNFFP